MILVIPELDMIVVTTGGGGPNQEDVIAGVWSTYIFPAIESDKPLAANPFLALDCRHVSLRDTCGQ